MNKKYLSYPNPILNKESLDFTDNNFAVEITKNNNIIDDIELNFAIEMNNKDFNRYINEKKACFAFKLFCPFTSYRELYHYFEKENIIKINIKNIKNEITIYTYIIAFEDFKIDHKETTTLNKDLYNSGYSLINKGDIVGIGPKFTIKLEEDINQNDSKSIISIVKKIDLDKGDVQVDFSGNRIVISLSVVDHDNYNKFNVKESYGELLASNYVIPTLVEALYFLKNEDENYLDCEWYKVIKNVIEKNNIDLESETSVINVLNKITPGLLNNTAKCIVEIDKMINDNNEVD